MKKIIALFTVGVLVVAGIACGQIDNPTPSEVQRDLELNQFKLPDGRIVLCIFYSRKGGDGYSWFSLDCDWDSAR